MDLKLQSFDGDVSKNINVSDTVLNCKYNESLVHQVVTA